MLRAVVWGRCPLVAPVSSVRLAPACRARTSESAAGRATQCAAATATPAAPGYVCAIRVGTSTSARRFEEACVLHAARTASSSAARAWEAVALPRLAAAGRVTTAATSRPAPRATARSAYVRTGARPALTRCPAITPAARVIAAPGRQPASVSAAPPGASAGIVTASARTAAGPAAQRSPAVRPERIAGSSTPCPEDPRLAASRLRGMTRRSRTVYALPDSLLTCSRRT